MRSGGENSSRTVDGEHREGGTKEEEEGELREPAQLSSITAGSDRHDRPSAASGHDRSRHAWGRRNNTLPTAFAWLEHSGWRLGWGRERPPLWRAPVRLLMRALHVDGARC